MGVRGLGVSMVREGLSEKGKCGASYMYGCSGKQQEGYMWVTRLQSRFLPQPLPERVPSVSRTATPLRRGCEARDIAGTTHGLDSNSLQPQATWLTGRDMKGRDGGTLHIRDHGY